MRTARTLALLRAAPRGRLRAIGYLIAVAGPAAVVLVFLPFRDTLQPLTIGFTFLVVVVAAAIVGRLGPGLLAAVVSFLTFNFFFLPPYDSFVIARGEHVVALVVFLALSVLISSLYSRAVERAEVAEAKERELQTLQELSRDLVVRGPGEEMYGALLGDVVTRFGFDAGALFVSGAEGGLDERVVVGAPAGSISPSWNPADPGRAPQRLPLSVGNRTLGLIVLTGSRPALDPAEVRVLRAVCDQLALVLERDRLLRTATDAEILRQTETARRTMLAAVSHDLRSPLAAIKASVTDLLDPDVERSTAERAAVLHVVDSEADRLDALVANLLDLSRIEAGVVQAHLEHVDLAETVTAEVDAAALRWPDVHIAMAIDDGHEVAVADPVFFPRVVSNLLDNAARSARGRRQPVGGDRDRSDRPRAAARPGGGQGRRPRGGTHHAGAHPAVPALRPARRADDETRLRPRARDRAGVRRSDGRGDLARGHPGRRRDLRLLAAGGLVTKILVVDDEPQIREAIERSLVARDYAVELAADGALALDLAAASPPDLVVLDLNMPVLDGLEFCRRIRAWSSVPIIVLSVRDEEPDKIAALDLGADDYLTKPFGTGELLARVRALLRRGEGAPPTGRRGTGSTACRSTCRRTASRGATATCISPRRSGRCWRRSRPTPGSCSPTGGCSNGSGGTRTARTSRCFACSSASSGARSSPIRGARGRSSPSRGSGTAGASDPAGDA